MAKCFISLVALSIFVLGCVIVKVDAQRRSRSNCRVGPYCDRCAEGEYQVLTVGSRALKVCCSGCGSYFRAGYRTADNLPYCQCDDPSSIRGDCWVGSQCDACMTGDSAGYVGRINSVPICCRDCERSGLAIGPRYCRCRHNGP